MDRPAPSLQPPASKSRTGILFVISAPSGAGKTSICREIMALFPNLRPSISYTTRPMRSGEQDGVDYHFVSRQTFDNMVASGGFAEWAEVHGNCYGTAKATLEQARAEGFDVLLDIDYQGAAQLRMSSLDGVFIFVLPPSMAELQRRLVGRNTDGADVIARRLQNAKGEIARAVDFDYLVVNEDLQQAIDAVKAIMVAEAVRCHRVVETLPEEFGLK